MIIYSQEIKDNELISKRKIQQIMIKFHSDKVFKKIDIINNFLKLMNEFLICAITCLIQNCQHWKYFSEIFKITQIIIIQKINKKNYQKFNFWKLITLLKIINKIIKVVMTAWLCNMIKKHNMFLSQQIKAHQNKFIKITLTLLFNQIHTVWKEKNNVAMLLLFNIFEAFFRILQE